MYESLSVRTPRSLRLAALVLALTACAPPAVTSDASNSDGGELDGSSAADAAHDSSGADPATYAEAIVRDRLCGPLLALCAEMAACGCADRRAACESAEGARCEGFVRAALAVVAAGGSVDEAGIDHCVEASERLAGACIAPSNAIRDANCPGTPAFVRAAVADACTVDQDGMRCAEGHGRCSGETCRALTEVGGGCGDCAPPLVCGERGACLHASLLGGACGQLADDILRCDGALRCVDGACLLPRTDGMPCVDDEDCGSGLYCNTAGAPATCAPVGVCPATSCGYRATCEAGGYFCLDRLARGEPCTDNAECEPGLFCDIRTAASHCEVPRPLGMTCNSYTPCEASLYCDGAFCRTLPTEGDPCGVGGASECAPGLVCRPGTVCGPQLAEGDACTVECGGDLVCQLDGTCGPGPDEGEPCAPERCGAGLFCESDVCVPGGGPGDPCVTNVQCTEGACAGERCWCNAAACVPAEGAECASTFCVADLACYATASDPIARCRTPDPTPLARGAACGPAIGTCAGSEVCQFAVLVDGVCVTDRSDHVCR